MSFNLDEQIDQLAGKFNRISLAKQLKDPILLERDQIRELLRDFYEYVRPEQYDEHPEMNPQESGYNAAIDEMNTKAKELGL